MACISEPMVFAELHHQLFIAVDNQVEPVVLEQLLPVLYLPFV